MRGCGVFFLAAAVAGALMLPAATSARSSTSLVLRFVSITTSARAEDKPPRGPSVGDRIFASAQLRNAVAQLGRPKGAVVGADRGTLTFMRGGAVTVDVTVTLPGGTLRVHGPSRRLADGSERYPVAGGTGRFAGARGTLTLRPLGLEATRASNVYRLTLP